MIFFFQNFCLCCEVSYGGSIQIMWVWAILNKLTVCRWGFRELCSCWYIFQKRYTIKLYLSKMSKLKVPTCNTSKFIAILSLCHCAYWPKHPFHILPYIFQVSGSVVNVCWVAIKWEDWESRFKIVFNRRLQLRIIPSLCMNINFLIKISIQTRISKSVFTHVRNKLFSRYGYFIIII